MKGGRVERLGEARGATGCRGKGAARVGHPNTPVQGFPVVQVLPATTNAIAATTTTTTATTAIAATAATVPTPYKLS